MIDVVFGTRPEAIKLAILVKHLQASGIPHRTISTGQHKEMLHQVLNWFDIQPQFDLDLMHKNQTLSGFTAKALIRLQEFYNANGKPNVVCVQGDTTTAFVAGLVAYYNKVKVAHIEAGLRTHNKWSPFPEEVNRRLLTQLADYHFAPTKLAYETLLKEGTEAGKVFLTGNTVIDALLYSKNKIDEQQIVPNGMEDFYTGSLTDRRIVLITGHRRENFGQGFENICKAIRKLAGNFPNVYFIYPVHLNPNVQEVVHRLLSGLDNVRLIAPLEYSAFIALMVKSYFILTDSGGVQEEAPSLKKPVLVMRENTERMEGVNAGVVKLVGVDWESIYGEAERLLTSPDYYSSFLKNENPYGDGTASAKVLKQLVFHG